MRSEQTIPKSLLSQLVIHDEFEARYWARVLGMSRAEVRAAFPHDAHLTQGAAVQAPHAAAPWDAAPGSTSASAEGRAQQG